MYNFVGYGFVVRCMGIILKLGFKIWSKTKYMLRFQECPHLNGLYIAVYQDTCINPAIETIPPVL